MTVGCGQAERMLSLYLDGELPPERRREVEGHLETCTDCRATLDAWARLGTAAIDILRQAVPADPLNVRAVSRPRRIATRTSPSPSLPQWIPLAAAGLLVLVLGLLLAPRPGGSRREHPASLPAAARGTETAASHAGTGPERPSRPSPALDPDIPQPAARQGVSSDAMPPSVAPPPPPDPPLPETAEIPPTPPPASRPAETPPSPPPDGRPAQPPPRTDTVAIAARIDAIHGSVSITTDVGSLPAMPGFGLLPGQGISTGDPPGHAVLSFPDGTRLELDADTTVTRVGPPAGPEAGQRIELARGTLDAQIARQPAGRSMRFVTPLAEVVVLGTRLKLEAEPDTTRVEVRSGRVRLTRLADRASADARGGQAVTAGRTGPLTVRPLPDLTLAFQDGLHPDPGYAGTRDTTLREDTPERGHGALSTCYVDSDDPGGTGQNVCALVRWDLTRIPPGSIVTSACVSLEITSSVKRRPYPFFEVLKPWDETGATWLTAATASPWDRKGAQGIGDRGRVPLAKTPENVGKGPLTIRLNARGVAVVQAWVNQPDSNHGILLDHDNNPDGMDFRSRETRKPDQRPKLTVTFIPPAGPERR